MKRISKIGSALSVLVLALVLTGSLPVFAQNGDSGTETETQTTTSDQSGSTSSTDQSSTKAERQSRAAELKKQAAENKKHAAEVKEQHQQDAAEVKADGAELRERGEKLLAEAKKDHKEKSEAERQKVCENRSKGLTTKFASITKASTGTKSRIDNIFAKAQAYQQSQNVVVANYDTLVAAAQTAQANAASAITVLQGITPNLDCTQPGTTASNVATFKAAAQQTRDSLKSYRQAVKAILQALENAENVAAPTANTTEGSAQ